MTDNHGIERLVFESYPLICSGMIDTLVNTCEETKYMAYGLKAMSLSIYIKDAEIDLNDIVLRNKIYKDQEQEAESHKIDVETAKVAQMNQNLITREMLWRAKFNNDCLQNFSVKANTWGAYDYNSEGYEYYSGGYYSEYSKDSYYRSTREQNFSPDETFYANTSSFDWREKHNAHLATSSYFDGNPDSTTVWYPGDISDIINEQGNGWLTSVKQQTVGAGNCPNGCYIFGTTAAAEGCLNLLTNQHLDYDISEQHFMECNASYNNNYTCYSGGSVVEHLFYNGYCFVDETTFPWLDSMNIVNPTCQPTGSAIFSVKFDTVFFVTANKRNLMTYGPIPTKPRFGHMAALVGFKRVMAGDTLRTNNGWGITLPDGSSVSDTLIIPEDHPYVGRTAWTFKESRSILALESGYITKLAENDGLPYGGGGKTFNGYVINCQTGDTIEPAYHDYDGDGYWNWGTGPKPAACPGPDLEDCNDDDPLRLYYDDRMFCTYDCDSVQQLTSDVPVYINSDTTMYGGILTRPIIVNGYATLTMKGEFQCTPNVYIQAEINASISLKSSLFFSVCGTDWIGFKLKANQDPADSLPIGRAYIGVRNSVISNAQCAIDGDSYALIYANKSDFINNKCDVYLHPHVYSSYYTSVSNHNQSKFYQCNFLTDSKRHADTCIAHIKLDYTKSVEVDNCLFEDAGVDNRVFYHKNRIGADLYSAGITFTDNKCENLSCAVKTVNSLYIPVEIKNDSIFNCHFAIYMSATHGQEVTGNYIEFPNVDSTASEILPYGIYLDYCHDFQVENNYIYANTLRLNNFSFTPLACGIIANDCFSNDEEIYRNKFRGLAVGTEAIGLNKDAIYDEQGLKINCNDFGQNDNDIFITNDLTNPYPPGEVGIAYNQGSLNDPSGNLFTCDMDFTKVYIIGGNEVYSLLYSDFANYLNDADHLNYYHHDTTETNEVYPDSVYNVTRIETSSVLNSNSCPDRTIDTTGGGPGIGLLMSVGSDIGDIDNTLNGLVDGGNTTLTVAEIVLANDNTAWQTYLDLMDKSPYLSNESLKEVAKKEDGLTAPMVRDVLVANPQAAKSPEVKILLDERIDELPDYMIEQIEAGITEISPKEYLEAQKASLKKEYAVINSKILREYLREPEVYSDTDIENLLNIYPDNRSAVKLAEYYASSGNYLQAKSVINGIEYENIHEQNEIDNLVELYTILDTMGTTLNSGTINGLLNIEMQGGIAGAYARGLLVKEDIIEYNEPVYLPNIMVNKNAEIFKLEQENKYFKVYPNPASDYIYIDYKLPEESKNISLKIVSVGGKVEKTIKLKCPVDNKLIKLGNLSSGTYIFVLETNGKTVDSTNITIAK